MGDEGPAPGTRVTRRLRLEPIGPGHAEAIWQVHQDPVVVAWWAGAWSREKAEAFAADCRGQWERNGVGKWMAYLHDGTLVGRGGLSRMPADGASTAQIERLVEPAWTADRLEIGWSLLSGFHGRGYATELGLEGLAFAESVLHARAVVSFTERHNRASRRVMERIGMEYAGEIRARGLVEGRAGERDNAPFAVHARHLGDP